VRGEATVQNLGPFPVQDLSLDVVWPTSISGWPVVCLVRQLVMGRRIQASFGP
jgi:hypothetical protein